MNRSIRVAGLIPLVFAALTLPLFFQSLFSGIVKTRFIDALGQGGIIWLLGLGATLMLVAAIVFCRVVDRLSEEARKRVTCGLFVLMALVMAFFICNFRALHNSDQFFMLDLARGLAERPGTIIDTDSMHAVYYGRYGNNYFLVIFFMHLYRLCQALHVADDYRVLVVLNACCIYLGNVFAYASVKLMRGPRTATKALLPLVMNPLNYTLIFWVYSATMSIPLMTGAVYLALRAHLAKDTKGKCLFALLSGINGALAYQVRPTSLIPLVAAGLLALFFVLKNHDTAKTVAIQALVCIVSLLIVSRALSAAWRPYVSQEMLDRNYPLAHWIMMSSHDKGSYSSADEEFTAQFETKEEKSRQDWQRAKENYRELGLSGTPLLFLRKLTNTFCDGDSLAQSRLEQDELFTPAYAYLAGDRNDLLTLYMQSFRVATLLAMVAGGISLWRTRRIAADWSLIMTSVMGGYVFYCLWETKSVYSAPFVPLMVLAASLGCMAMTTRLDALDDTRRHTLTRTGWRWGVSLIALTCLAMYFVMAKTDYVRKDYVRRDSQTKLLYFDIDGMHAEGDTLAQEVDITHQINRVDVTVNPNALDKPTSYRLDICDATGAVKASKDFDSSQVKGEGLKTYLPISIDYDPGEDRGPHLIRFTLTRLGAHPLTFKYRGSTSIDVYPGKAFNNGEERDYDLEVDIYNRYEAPFLRPIWCLGLYTLDAAGLALLVFAYRWTERTKPVPEGAAHAS